MEQPEPASTKIPLRWQAERIMLYIKATTRKAEGIVTFPQNKYPGFRGICRGQRLNWLRSSEWADLLAYNYGEGGENPYVFNLCGGQTLAVWEVNPDYEGKWHQNPLRIAGYLVTGAPDPAKVAKHRRAVLCRKKYETRISRAYEARERTTGNETVAKIYLKGLAADAATAERPVTDGHLAAVQITRQQRRDYDTDCRPRPASAVEMARLLPRLKPDGQKPRYSGDYAWRVGKKILAVSR